jgi:O-antigen/teichoic acid export membrane protein
MSISREGAVPPPATSESGVALDFLKLGTGEAAVRIVAFLTTVYVARRLGADAFGVVILATTIMTYVSRLSDCGVDLLGVRDVARDPQQLPVLLSSFTGARLLVAALLIPVTAGAGLLALPAPEGVILATYALTLLPSALNTRWAHLGLGRTGVVSASRGAAEALTAVLVITLVRAPQDVGRVPIAAVAGEALGALLLLVALPRRAPVLKPGLRPDAVASLYRRSWPLVFHALLGLLVMNSDYFFLRIYLGSATVGYYAAAYGLVGFVLNLGQSYQFSLLPAVTRLDGEPERQGRLYQTAAAQVFAATLPLAVGTCLVAESLMPAVFGSEYAPSVLPLQILIWSVPVALMRNVVQTVLIARERQDVMFRTSAWGAGANVALNVVVIPFWGMAGAAMVTLATECVRLVPMLRFLRRTGVPLAPLRRFWRTLVAAGVMTVVVMAAGPRNVWLSVIVGALAYIGALYLAGGLRFRRGTLPELVT